VFELRDVFEREENDEFKVKEMRSEVVWIKEIW